MARGSDILEIIPRTFKVRGIAVSLTILLRALLNFFGLAALLPILYLILDSENIHSNAYLQRAYEWMGVDSDLKFVGIVSVTLVVFIVVKCVVNLYLFRFERNFIYALYRHLSREMFVGYFEKGLSFIKRSNSAVLSRNVNVVCYTFVNGILRPIAVIFSEMMLFVLLFAAMAIYNVWAAALTLLIFIPTVWIYYGLVRNRLNRYGDTENEAQRKKYRDVSETYRGYTDIELSNAFPKMLASFDSSIDTIVTVGRKNATIGTLPTLITEIGVAVGLTLLVTFSVGMESGDLKILFGFFAVAALRLLPSVRAVMGSWTSIRYNKYTIDTILESRRDAAGEKGDYSQERMPLKRCITVDDICYRFPDSDQDIISHMSIEVHRGERVGIRGRSGVGKTTLLNLLLGFYHPTSGRILIDGTELDSTTRRRWQNTIGYVSQSIFLSDKTIRENIALGFNAEEIDTKRLAESIRIASLEQFISSLPKGLDTRIGECGALLSGGQRQRIGIARALYRNIDVLLFDEATSSLDSETEQNINNSISSLSEANKDLTIIVVAHRESSLEYCDRIITIE